ncbi:homeobox protein Hox-A5a isoform X2 [Scleropages formosus]|uniref:homeobox protein Hox-A5a isoform X2 n=1 Tax=Scleropages formosus TaxID=113540 RepID=UPI0010FABC08|nr:homeobox protein Hox-A5 isoform X2 [Scleropages formosus]
MSSYFVNSFCGRYPNGAEYQLHNYGDHSSATEQYRDSTSMHSSRYGYGFNGMDLSVGRSTTSHFGASVRAPGYTPSATAASAETRYSQPATASHSPPPDPIPCSSVANSPVSESHRAVKNSISNPATSPSSSNNGCALLSRDGASKAPAPEEDKPGGSAQTTSQNISETPQPQIYPWMRKLHISHELCGMELEHPKHVKKRLAGQDFSLNKVITIYDLGEKFPPLRVHCTYNVSCLVSWAHSRGPITLSEHFHGRCMQRLVSAH